MPLSSFFQGISNYFTSGSSVLGVDIGTSSIKMVELSPKGGGFVLKNYGIIDTKDYLLHPNLAIQSGSLSLDVNETSRLLAILLKETKTEARNVIMSVPVFTSFVNLIDAPALSDSEMKGFINIQAQQYVPMSIDEISTDWLVVDRFKDKEGKENQRIMIIGIPNKSLQVYKEICQKTGLKLSALELDVVSLSRSVQPFSDPTLVVDIGAEATTVFIVEGGFLKYVSQAEYSGVHITRALSTSLELGMLRAEDLKRRHGIFGGSSQEQEFSSLITPFLNVIIKEVGRIIDSYEKRYDRSVKQFAVVGGGSNLSGIKEYFTEKLGLKNIPIDVFRDIELSGTLHPISESLGRELAVAIGLSKKHFER